MHIFRLLLLLLAEMEPSGVCSAHWIVMPEQVSGVMGKSINFTASDPPSPDVETVTWTFSPKPGTTVPIYTAMNQNERAHAPYTGRVKYYRETYTLELSSLTLTDRGIYTLTVVDFTLTQLVGQTTLVVLEPIADVKIVSNLPEAVEFNSTVVLNCSAKGSNLLYDWLNNSTPMLVDGKHVLQNGSQLIISQVLRSDLQGLIYCVAKNQAESESSAAFTLTVNYGPDLTTIKQEPKYEVLTEGSNLTLTCSAKSNPAVEVTWLHNATALDQDTATLVLTNFGRNQSGKYVCLVYNKKTERYGMSEVITLTLIDAEQRVSDGKLSAGAIAGIFIACLLLLAIVVIIYKKRQTEV